MTNKDKIHNLLISDNLFSITRIGGIETIACYNYLMNINNSKDLINKLKINAGFYYENNFELQLFCEHCISSINNSDLFAFWNSRHQKALITKIKSKNIQITLKDLEPFWENNSWLTSKKPINVVVVSPFSNSINGQLLNLKNIFNKDIYPNINFITIQAPITNGSVEPTHSYFTNVNNITNQIVSLRPNFVLLGCGSYGLVIANLLRQKFISSIVVGGSLQLYFGIKGARWESREEYKNLFNKFWIKPSNNEKPKGSNLIEDGCYW